MDVSVDTNILIHLYKASSKELLLSSFDNIYVHEYIIDVELKRNSRDTYLEVEEDIKSGRIIKVNNSELASKGIKALFEECYLYNKILFAEDRGEAYAVALASVIGIEAFVSDDTKYGGPHETLVMEYIEDVIPFTFYELLFLKYLKSEINCNEFKLQFDKISAQMTRPMDFKSRVKKVLNRYHKDRSSKRDYLWLKDYCEKHNIDIRFKIRDLLDFIKK